MRQTRVFLALTIVVLTAGYAHATNSIIIDTKSWPPCMNTTIGIYIENDVDLKRISLPLVIRSSGAFWAGPVDTIPTTGRLATTLTGSRIFEKGRVDFVTPDQVALVYEAGPLGSDCLPAGPSQKMTGLSFKTNEMAGQWFEIDTMAYAPCFTLEMLGCSGGAPVPIMSFSKGIVYVMFYTLPYGNFSSDSLGGFAGGSFQNQGTGVDPEGDPLAFRLTSGPGEINPNTGKWSWNSCTRDTGRYVVTAEVYEKDGCGYGNPFSFVIRLAPQDRADVNCDGVADVFDLLAQIDYIYNGKPLPNCP